MKQTVRRVLKWIGIGVLVLFVAMFFLSCWYELEYDNVVIDTVEVDEPVPNFAWDMRSLDEYVRAQYPAECEGKELIGIDANYDCRNGVPEQGIVWMYYHPAISKLLMFRHVSRIDFRFDPIGQKLDMIRRIYGNAKAICYTSGLIDAELLAFPMDAYFRETAKRPDIEPGHKLSVYFEYKGEGLTIEIYDNSEDDILIDTEFITKP